MSRSPDRSAPIWVVSDGRVGIERQAASLARAVAAHADWPDLGGGSHPDAIRTVRLTPRGVQTALRPDLWPAPMRALPPMERSILEPPWPALWIASGRRSIAYSLMVKRNVGDACFVVQTQDPKVAARRFDLVIPPDHDGLRGPGVFPILGSPTWFDETDLARTASTPDLRDRRDAPQPAGPRILVSIGGTSKTHRLTPSRTEEIAAMLRRQAEAGTEIWITTSRRTPEDASRRLRSVAQEIGAAFWQDEARDGPNPYLAWLTRCDAALVTEDSANLIADAAFFARPIHLLKLEGGSRRFDRLHQGFISRGAARWFIGDIARWTYTPVREAARAADEILARMKTRRSTGGAVGGV
ncbi:hypothetical protein GC169_08015 [bacterium]|nr:hypothetical protein [bacterium]